MTMADWNPEQYRKFASERAQPFHDLLALVGPGPIRSAVDLGCGPGELTTFAARALDVERMLGLDNSPAMLAAAHEHADAFEAIGSQLRAEFAQQVGLQTEILRQPG